MGTIFGGRSSDISENYDRDLRHTGISSQIGTKLHDWAIWQARADCYSLAAMSSMTQRRCRLVGGIRAEIQTCKNYFAPLCTYTITLHTVNMIYLRMAPCEKYLSCYQVMAYFHYATLTPLAIWGHSQMTSEERRREGVA